MELTVRNKLLLLFIFLTIQLNGVYIKKAKF